MIQKEVGAMIRKEERERVITGVSSLLLDGVVASVGGRSEVSRGWRV